LILGLIITIPVIGITLLVLILAIWSFLPPYTLTKLFYKINHLFHKNDEN